MSGQKSQRKRAKNGGFVWIFLVLALAALLPLVRTRILPLLDEPNHLSAAYIFHHYDDAQAGLREFYEVHLPPVPYVAYHLLVHLSAYGLGIEIANKFVLFAYVLSLPLAALWWARRTGRGPLVALLAFPLAYSFSWSLGFHPFNIGLALFLFASAALDAFLERPTRPRALLAALLALACDFGHPLGVLAFYTSAAVLLAVHRPPLRRLWAALFVLAPAAIMFASQVLRPQVTWVAGSAETGPFILPHYRDVAFMLRRFPAHTMDSVSGHGDLVVFWVLLGTLVLLLIADWKKGPTASLRERLFRHRAGLLAATMLALYFLVPFELERPFSWWFVSGRFAPLVCFFAFLLPSGEARGRRLLFYAPALVAALALPVHISEKYAAFDERVSPFVRLVEHVPRGAKVLFLSMRPRTDPALNWAVFDQLGAWVQILHGGYSASGWFDTGHLFTTKKTLPAPPYYEHERFDPAEHAGPYEYIIVRNEARPLFEGEGGDFRLVAAEGAWKMYARSGDLE